jgi:transposase
LLFGDESEALTHPYLAHAWARRGADLRVPAPGQARKRAMLGVLDHGSGELIVHVSASKRSTDFIALLEMLDRRYGPKPGQAATPVVLVLDNGPIHTSKLTPAALAKRPWLTIERLPKYAPELNDIERSWRDLKRHFLAHQTVQSVEHLDAVLHKAILMLNQERQPQMCHDQRIAA